MYIARKYMRYANVRIDTLLQTHVNTSMKNSKRYASTNDFLYILETKILAG